MRLWTSAWATKYLVELYREDLPLLPYGKKIKIIIKKHGTVRALCHACNDVTLGSLKAGVHADDDKLQRESLKTSRRMPMSLMVI